MKQEEIQYGRSTITFSLEYADRKTMGIKVHPDKSVQVIAPTGSSEEKIKEKVKSKASWILKQQDFFLSFHPITPPRKYVSGETHLYLGRQYRLKLVESQHEAVKLQHGRIYIHLPRKKDSKRAEYLLKEWYTQKALHHFRTLFENCSPLAQKLYEGTPILKQRWMKKRWGSCSKKGEILLNIELIKAPKRCIEYVIIHELCHLVHLNHSAVFYGLLEQLHPNWRETKNKLERLMV